MIKIITRLLVLGLSLMIVINSTFADIITTSDWVWLLNHS